MKRNKQGRFIKRRDYKTPLLVITLAISAILSTGLAYRAGSVDAQNANFEHSQQSHAIKHVAKTTHKVAKTRSVADRSLDRRVTQRLLERSRIVAEYRGEK